MKNSNLFALIFIVGCTMLVFTSCRVEVETNRFKSYSDMVEYFDGVACQDREAGLIVHNYDGTPYHPQIVNPCEFNLDNYQRRNLFYLSTTDRKDGVDVNAHTQVIKSKMDAFVNNMGGHPDLSIDPSQAVFVLQLDEHFPMNTADHLLMALSVIYEEVLHFKYRKQMKGIPIILTDEELYPDVN